MEFTGKSASEAIDAGLKELGITIDQAKITVKNEAVKGLFGRIKEKAVVEIEKIEEEKEVKVAKAEKKVKAPTTKNADTEKTVEFVKTLLAYLDISADVEVSTKKDNTVLTLKTEQGSSLIGYRGEVIDALQTLAGAHQNIGKKEYQKVVVDCENYREKREDTLIKLAHRLEEKATEMRREVMLEPMSPFERRIIHTALADSQTVTTKSDGREPNRYVVIVPNDKDEYSRPYNAGRNNDKDRTRNNHGGKGGYSKDAGKNRPKSKPARKSPSVFGTYLGNSLKDE